MKVLGGDSTLSIGDLVVGGGANRVLFEDGSERLATDSDFTYVAATNTLTVDNITSNAATALVLNGVANITFSVASTQRWGITASGHFIAVDDNTYDIGASLATRPRTVYAGTSVIVGPEEAMVTANVSCAIFRAGTCNIVARDSTNNVEGVLQAGTSGINVGAATNHSVTLFTNNVARWTVQAGGHFVGNADNTYDIGATGASRPRSIYVATTVFAGTDEATITTNPQFVGSRAGQAAAVIRDTTNNIEAVLMAGTTQTFVGASSNHQLALITNNTARWAVTTAGHLIGNIDNTYDIGAAGATRPRSIYYGTTLVIPTGSAAAPAITDSTGTSGFYVFAAASWGWSSGGTIKLAFTANGAQAADGSAGNPAWSFMSSPTTGLFHDAANVIGFSTNATGRWKMSASGHFLAYTDNSFDIGATGATRPRSIYVATSINIEANNGLVTTNQTSGPGASLGTLTNAPSSGDPDFWHPISVNGTNGWFPIWYA